MKPGDPDSPLALQESLALIERAYGSKGYIAAKADAPQVDDRSTHQVAYTVSVVQGPQYRFKAVHFPSLGTEQAKQFAAAWQLKPGDVYNAEYPIEFLQKNSSLTRQGLRADIGLKLDPAELTVDVTITFSDRGANSPGK